MEVFGILVGLLVLLGFASTLFVIARDTVRDPIQSVGMVLTFAGWVAAWIYAVRALFHARYGLAAFAFFGGCVIYNVGPSIVERLKRGGAAALVEDVPRYDDLSARTKAALRVACAIAAVAWLTLVVPLRDFGAHPEIRELHGAAILGAVTGSPSDSAGHLHDCMAALSAVAAWIGSPLPSSPLLAVPAVFARIMMGLGLGALYSVAGVWLLMFWPATLGAHEAYFYSPVLAWLLWAAGSVVASLYLWNLSRLSDAAERRQAVAAAMRTVAVASLLAAGAFVVVKLAVDMRQTNALVVTLGLSVPLAVAEGLLKRGVAASSPAKIAGPVIVVTVWLLLQAVSTVLSARLT